MHRHRAVLVSLSYCVAECLIHMYRCTLSTDSKCSKHNQLKQELQYAVVYDCICYGFVCVTEWIWRIKENQTWTGIKVAMLMICRSSYAREAPILSTIRCPPACLSPNTTWFGACTPCAPCTPSTVNWNMSCKISITLHSWSTLISCVHLPSLQIWPYYLATKESWWTRTWHQDRSRQCRLGLWPGQYGTLIAHRSMHHKSPNPAQHMQQHIGFFQWY